MKEEVAWGNEWAREVEGGVMMVVPIGLEGGGV